MSGLARQNWVIFYGAAPRGAMVSKTNPQLVLVAEFPVIPKKGLEHPTLLLPSTSLLEVRIFLM